MNKDIGIMYRTVEAINSTDKNYKEIAAYIGCSRRSLYNYIDMINTMNATHLKRLCELSGYSADYILFGRENGTDTSI